MNDDIPTLLSITEVRARLSIGRTMIYAEIKSGRLKTVKIGDRTLIPAAELARYIAALPDGRRAA